MICRCFNRVICCISRKSLMKRIVLLLNLCMFKDGIMAPTQVLIDNEHLAEYPYCGSMDYEGSPYTGVPVQQEGCVGCIGIGRTVNANYSSDSTKYRWLVTVQMRNMNANREVKHFLCTGSVITDR